MKSLKLPIFKNLADFSGVTTGSETICNFFEALSSGSDVKDPFFSKALERIRREINKDIVFQGEPDDLLKFYWKIFFPEALLIERDKDEFIKDLRDKRTVHITDLNPNPIIDVQEELTFTSNILLTLPDKSKALSQLDLPESIVNLLPCVMEEKQIYWFDHPVQMGEPQESNEIIYGLKGLSRALAFEKKRGTVSQSAKIDVLLSLSVTHKGLQNLAAPYISYELEKAGGFPDLNIYIFTEKDTREILQSYSSNSDSISEFFGVDGKYARHYNFLKAVNVLWKLSVNPSLKGTFKIDLDQVFPQEELVKYTGKSAFEHLKSPLWGAEGVDREGRKVSLSMIAGALVNERDICQSLFTPDVSIPDRTAPISDLIFFKHLTMALSTRAEMMTRYGEKGGPDGKNDAITRIHVTGGTNGILIDALLKHRPFTPAFIGRAEDQAYLLSVLNDPSNPALRYYHEAGLIMRHDKEAFAGQSIEAAKDGTFIADILRVLFFSHYGEALPGGISKTKENTFPFTGSYISHYPVTLSYMRLFFKVLELISSGEERRALDLLKMGKERLGDLLDSLERENFIPVEYEREKKQWGLFYSEISKIASQLRGKNPIAREKVARLNRRLVQCLVN